MKFKTEAWRAVQPPPFHEGLYDVKLDNGKVVRIEYRQQQWAQDARHITEWRGQQLKGMDKPGRHRRAMDRYRAGSPKTHALAARSAHFLARRAVSRNAPQRAYQHYLVLHALAPSRLADVDTQWIQQFLAFTSLSEDKIKACRRKVDTFFKRRGGRPARG